MHSHVFSLDATSPLWVRVASPTVESLVGLNWKGHRLTLLCGFTVILSINLYANEPVPVTSAPTATQSSGVAYGIAAIVLIIPLVFLAVFLMREYVRSFNGGKEHIKMPEAMPEIKVWDEKDIELIVRPREVSIGLIQKLFGLLWAHNDEIAFSRKRKQLLLALQDEVRERLVLKRIAINYKIYEQRAINQQIQIENRRRELLLEQRLIESKSNVAIKKQACPKMIRGAQLIGSDDETGFYQHYYRTEPPDYRYKRIGTFCRHTGSVDSIAFSPVGDFLASASWDGTVRLWTYDGDSKQTSPSSNGFSSVAFSSDGRLLAAGSWNGSIKVFSVENLTPVNTLVKHSDVVEAVAFSPLLNLMASASWDGTIKLWDTGTWQVSSTLHSCQDKLSSVAFSSDGKLLAAGSWSGKVRLWKLRDSPQGDQPLFKKLECSISHEDVVSSVAFSPVENNLAISDWARNIKIWSVGEAKEFYSYNRHEKQISSIAFSPDGRILASGSWDNTVKIWQTDSSELLYTLTGHQAQVTSVAFSRDGRFLASSGLDRMIIFWAATAYPEGGRV